MRYFVNWLFELRSVGDYGVSLHVVLDDASRAVRIAEDFLDAVKNPVVSLTFGPPGGIGDPADDKVLACAKTPNAKITASCAQ